MSLILWIQKFNATSKFSLLKGATSWFVNLEKFSLNFQVGRFQSVLIFAILNHPHSFLVDSILVFFYLTKVIFCCFPHVQGYFERRRKLLITISPNIVYRLVFQILPYFIEIIRVSPLVISYILYYRFGGNEHLTTGVFCFFLLLLLLTVIALIPTGSPEPSRLERIAR